MTNQANAGEAVATRGGDAPVVRDTGGDRTVQSFSSQVDSIRKEPGQGLDAEKDRINKTDVTSMGFPNTRVADAGQNPAWGDGLKGKEPASQSWGDALGTQSDSSRGDGSKDAVKFSSPKDGGTSPFHDAGTQSKADKPNSDKPNSDKPKSDKPHACHVKPGEKPDESGIASIFNEVEKTATGEMNDPSKHTAAHKHFPLNSKLCVTRPGESTGTEIRINDRGPYIKGRVIDMTPVSAKEINIKGLGKVDIYRPGKYEK